MIIPQSLDDWSLYYGNSYFRIRDKNDQWFWIHAINVFEPAGDDLIRCHYSKDDGKRYHHDLNVRQLNFDLNYPDCHYYFLNGEALLLHRRSVRAATKTLSQDNAVWLAPIREVMPDNFRFASKIGGDWINRLDKNLVDFPLDAARTMTSNGKALTVPLKKEWALSLSPYEKYDHLLWFRSTPVGLFQRDNLHVSNPIFRQEIADVFGTEARIINHGD